MNNRLSIGAVQHPRIAVILSNIHADNSGCTATEWEKMLEDFTDEELWILAAGEDGEQKKLLIKMRDAAVKLGYNKRQATSFVRDFHKWLNAAFN